MKRYPLKLTGIPKAAIWGGARLKTAYGKKADFDSIAESWELSVRDGATNAVENGEGAGLSLSECFEKMGLSSVLPNYDGKTCPLLVKLIDADQPLSVQVHPDDDYAKSHGGGNGKTEMWVVIDAKPGAELVMGLADGVGRADFSSAVEKKKYDGIMKRVPVKPGDVFFIPSGMLHAIGGGILIAEVQQNCDTTYRVWDYDRRDKNGDLRPLHIKEALDVVRPFADGECDALRYESKTALLPGETLVNCRYFEVARLTVSTDAVSTFPADRFTHLLVLSGAVRVSGGGEVVSAKAGDSILLPAGTETPTLSGNGTVLLSCPKGE